MRNLSRWSTVASAVSTAAESEQSIDHGIEDPLLQERDLNSEASIELTANLDDGPKKSKRFRSLDLMRGFIMVIMAWDHTKDIVADTTQKGQEGWNGEGATWNNNFMFFFARAISDICAPGFFYTMGISIVLFSSKRIEKNWSWKRILNHFVTRSIILFIVGRLVNPPFMVPGLLAILRGDDFSDWRSGAVYNMSNVEDFVMKMVVGIFEVMTGLSLVMFVSATCFLYPLWVFHKRYPSVGSRFFGDVVPAEILTAAMFVLLFVWSNVIIVHYQDGHLRDPDTSSWPFAPSKNFWQDFLRFFILPGPVRKYAFAAYPIVPWLGITLLGMGTGFAFLHSFEKAQRKFGVMSLVFFILFLVLRTFGGAFGNIRGYPRHDGSDSDQYHVNWIIEYFYMSKYPPSPTYALFWLSMNFGLILLFSKEAFNQLPDTNHDHWLKRFIHACSKILLVFGRVPLFFYIVHFWFICTIFGVPLELMYGVDYRVRLPLAIPFWIVLIIAMYPICVKYGTFKKSQPADSWWQLI
mmetsp:Transcript_6491/g.7423  ORF Transcript_6491/g.7423 Transcript_6491/m.7423 type:complete len:522 (-) Transcript_6491:96-1661(-)